MFKRCPSVDNKGIIPIGSSLQNCLRQKYGWKKYTTRPLNYKPGYPIFRKDGTYSALVIEINGNRLITDSHTPDRCQLSIDAKDSFYYFYP